MSSIKSEPLVLTNEMIAKFKDEFGATFEQIYKSHAKLADRFPKEVEADLRKVFTPITREVKDRQETYRYNVDEKVMYKVMQAAYPPLLELFAEVDVRSTPNESFFRAFRIAEDRQKFINSNELRKARFFRHLQNAQMSEDEYYKDFAIRMTAKKYSLIAALIEMHPTENPDVDFKQYLSDIDYPERTAKEILYHDDVYAEIY